MALLNSDLLAVYREGDKKNYSVTVSQLVAKTPAPVAPALNAVLESGNTSNGFDINIETSGGTEIVNLKTDTASVFKLGLTTDGTITVGATPKATIATTGTITAVQTALIGDITTGDAITVYPAGATVESLTGDPTVTITNEGVATFAGALEALEISGGTY